MPWALGFGVEAFYVGSTGLLGFRVAIRVQGFLVWDAVMISDLIRHEVEETDTE